MEDIQLKDRYSVPYRTTSFGKWTRTPDTKVSRQIDAIRNLTGVSVDGASRVYTIPDINTSCDWANAEVGAPEF